MDNGLLVNAGGPQLHIRFEGRSIDVPQNELDIGDASTDDQIRTAVADHLGAPVGKLRAFAIDRNRATGEITLRPEAVFGVKNYTTEAIDTLMDLLKSKDNGIRLEAAKMLLSIK